jgi:RHS repeat-associated protein
MNAVGYVYDGLKRRRITRNYTWQSSQWVETNEIHYIYDSRLVIQERDTNNNPLVTYMRGLDLSLSLQGAGGIGGLLARTDTNGSTYYHADGSGNITALINGDENIVARYRYDAFGKLLGEWGTNANANTYRFSSKEYDSTSGLYYYDFRFYEPNFQRWLNHDPIQERGGINLYGFVGNNPVSSYDSDGRAVYYNFGPGGQYSQGFVYPGTPGSPFDLSFFNFWTSLAGCQDSFDQRFAQAMSEATSLFPYGSLGEAEILEAVDLGYLSQWDLPADFSSAWSPSEQGYMGTFTLGDEGNMAFLALVGAAAGPLEMMMDPEMVAVEEGSFFDGTTYSSKVLQQMQDGPGEFHSFPESVAAFESSGTVSTITGGDGQAYQMLEIPGSYQSTGGTWYNGSFQFIQDANGVINHRLFVPSP